MMIKLEINFTAKFDFWFLTKNKKLFSKSREIAERWSRGIMLNSLKILIRENTGCMLRQKKIIYFFFNILIKIGGGIGILEERQNLRVWNLWKHKSANLGFGSRKQLKFIKIILE